MQATAPTDLDGCAPDASGFGLPECDPHPVSVLGKAHLLLGAFAPGATCLGLTELSRRSGVPKATVHRLGMELAQLGWRIFELGQLVPGPASLCGVARPALIDLRAVTRAVIHLSVPHGTDCVYLERLGGRKESGIVSAVGMRVPSLLTASGRLFLAYNGDKDDLDASVSDPAVADKAAAHGTVIVDFAHLTTEFELIRTRRWSEERGLCLPGFKTFAVPIMYGGSDRALAAVSATVPVERRDEQRLIYALWAAAADISRDLQRAVTSRAETPQRARLAG